MHVVTNFPRFPERWQSGNISGTAAYAETLDQFTQQGSGADVLLVNCDASLTLALCRHRWPAQPRRPRLASVDIVLRAPSRPIDLFPALFKRYLLRKVDLFVNYFTDLRGYEALYGISPARSAFVPFKPNLRHRVDVPPSSEGDAVLCLGRSMRDYDSFFTAMERLPHPAIIPRPDFAQLTAHRSRFTRPLDRLPSNVTVVDDDGSEESLVRLLLRARVVALPILRRTICASGLSIYLNAMLLGKCVVLTNGPGVSDILTDGQAILAPPEKPLELARAIDQAWRDDALRHRTAESGHRYALSLGGEPELRQRIIDVVATHRSLK